MVHRPTDKKKRLQNILAHAGVASRRRAAELIEDGKVKVDGDPVTEKGHRIDPDRHEITVGGRPLPKEEKKHYFLFNKPPGIISTASDTHGRKTVTDYFAHLTVRLYPVGRLDKDTTGILIVTNDGELTHKLAHPSFEVEKEYEAEVEHAVSPADVKRLEKGIRFEGRKTAPCEIKRLRRPSPAAVYRVKLHEGRKRQVRKMFGEVGSRVTSLKRVRYAALTLGHLKRGQFRELTAAEVKRLKELGRK